MSAVDAEETTSRANLTTKRQMKQYKLKKLKKTQRTNAHEADYELII